MRYALALTLVYALGCGAPTGPDTSVEDASTTLPDGASCPVGERICPGFNYCTAVGGIRNCGVCGNTCTASAPACVRLPSGSYACQ